MQQKLIETEADESVELVKRNPNKMIKTIGPGPKDKKCRHCDHCFKIIYHDRGYYKCELVPITHGKGSDVKLKWDACAGFAPKKATK